MSTSTRYLHEHEHPVEEVERVVAFVVAQAREIEGGLAIRIRESREAHHNASGFANYGRKEYATRLRCRHSISLRFPGDEFAYGQPRVCWHSTEARRAYGENPTEPGGMQLAVAKALEAGKTKVGRWPIYLVRDWQEALVHLAAHEVSHIVQLIRRRGQSEIVCEQFAAYVLGEWRKR